MKHIFQYFSVLLLLLTVSCQDDEIMNPQRDLKTDEHLISFSISEPVAATRAMGEQPSKESFQNLHVLVFDENGLYLANQEATDVTLNTPTTGTFKVNIPQSDVKRILHFIAGNVTYDTYSRKDTEGTIFSKLSSTNQEDAYWQRIEVDKVDHKDQKLSTTIGTVKLLRNFAKISVAVSQEVESDGKFQMLGYAVVNYRDAGAVAPYLGGTSEEFANFQLPNNPQEDIYTLFTKQNPDFSGKTMGRIPAVEPEAVATSCTLTPKYIYEQQQVNNPNPVYVIVKASYMNQECFYKLDIVRTDDANYITSYLNIFRNFHYTIRINKVAGKGSTDIETAMSSAASNNLAASVEVSEVNRIEDGVGNMLEVQTIDTMLVHTTPITLRVNYTEQKQPTPGKVIVTPVPELNTAALKAVSYDKQGNITITPADNLPSTMQIQELVVSTPSGLSRRISIKVRKPYVFDLVTCQEKVEKKINAQLGMGIRLPQNMPAAAFPLTLQIEPVERKSFYPNPEMNTLPVHDGVKTFTYEVEISYNDYRKSRSFYLHFLTNMQESETSIKVSNPFFEDRNNTCRFSNTEGTLGRFTNVSFGTESEQQNVVTEPLYTKIPIGIGQEVILKFNLMPNHQYTVGIQPGDYLEFVSSNTGSAVEHESNGGLAYRPNNPTEQQVLKFKTTANVVGSTFQLYSVNYEMIHFTYRNSPIKLQLRYGRDDTPINKGEVELYNDSNYSGRPAKTFVTDDQGFITLETFAGHTYDDILYFQYKKSSGWWGTTTYRGSISVRDIINGGTGNNTLTLTTNY